MCCQHHIYNEQFDELVTMGAFIVYSSIIMGDMVYCVWLWYKF